MDQDDLRIVVAGTRRRIELGVHMDHVELRRRCERCAHHDVIERLRIALEVVGVTLVQRKALDQIVERRALQRGERCGELEVV